VHLPISFYYKVAKLHRFHIHASIEAFYGHYTNLRIINLKCIPVANLGYTISPSPCWKQLLNFGCLRESGPQVFMNEFPHCSFEASNRAGDLTAFMQQIPDTRIVIRVNACTNRRFWSEFAGHHVRTIHWYELLQKIQTKRR
jgi:hypothetical protein